MPVVGRLALASSPGRTVVTVAPGTSVWMADCRTRWSVAATVARARKLLIAPQPFPRRARYASRDMPGARGAWRLAAGGGALARISIRAIVTWTWGTSGAECSRRAA